MRLNKLKKEWSKTLKKLKTLLFLLLFSIIKQKNMLKINTSYNKIEERYKKRKLQYKPKELTKFINTLYKQAKKNYSKLSEPKFCSLKSYIDVWVNEEISKDIAKKSLTSINLKNPPNEFKATVKFYTTYQIKKTNKPINFNTMKNDWLEMVKERNLFSQQKGYKSTLDMTLKNLNIPKSEYKKFLKNINQFINFYKKQIYSTWTPVSTQNLDNFCLICNSKFFPFNNLSDFLNFFQKKSIFYRKNKNKINIQFENYSETKYIKETDTFKITLKQNTNINHQILDLIHELSHVSSMVKILGQNRTQKTGAYLLEKLAIKKEIIFLKKYFPEALKSKLENILRIIYQTLFEIEIYQNPQKNPNKIYLKYLKKCSKNVTEKDGWNYLSNQDILYKSFSQLIYAVAYTNVLNHPTGI